MEQPPTSPSVAICAVCDSRFVRREHLIRHMRIHTREKPYYCSICDKKFSRQDVLTRHIASHGDRDRLRINGPLATRACEECAASRARCSREYPCQRCSGRQLTCKYPARRKRRGARRDQDQGHQHGGNTDSAALLDVPIMEGTAASDKLHVSTCQALHLSHFDDGPYTNEGNVLLEDMFTWIDDVDPTSSMTLGLNQPYLGLSGIGYMASPAHVDVDIDLSPQIPNLLMNSEGDLRSGSSTGPSIYDHPSGLDLPGRAPHSDPTRVSQPIIEAENHRQATGNAQGHTEWSSDCNVRALGASTPTTSTPCPDDIGSWPPLGDMRLHRSSMFHLDMAQDGHRSAGSEAISTTIQIPLVAHQSMTISIKAECYHHGIDLHPALLPSYEETTRMVQCYFDYFHPVLPFLRQSSFSQDVAHDGILLLAVSVAGARYLRPLRGQPPSESLLDILQKSLSRQSYGFKPKKDNAALYSPEGEAIQVISPRIQTLQAGILAILCMLHCGKQSYMERAFLDRYYLVEACGSLDLLSPRSTPRSLPLDEETPPNQFARWVQREFEIRAGMMIWLIDSMCLYEFNSKRLIDLADVQNRLPVNETLWESSGRSQPASQKLDTMTLPEAIEILYHEKRLPTNLGDFSTSLLVNAIYIRTRDVQVREQLQLHTNAPTAGGCRIGTETNKSTWLPSSLIISRWRNSACDRLNVLHCSANGKAAALSGTEHHTILHLHLSRLILLTPTKDIQTFATTLSAVPTEASSEPIEKASAYTAARDQILQWVMQDQFKARLCVVHCGALFWHVRRYSCNSVMEPYAIYIATLVLWAFCEATQLIGIDLIQAHADCETSLDGVLKTTAVRGGDLEPLFIHLDRPLDDELVQMFVGTGHKMAAYIARVGNIQDTAAPIKILEEGIRLLGRSARMPCAIGSEGPNQNSAEASCVWGIEASFRESLKKIARATRERSVGHPPVVNSNQ